MRTPSPMQMLVKEMIKASSPVSAIAWNAPRRARHEGQSSAFCTADRRASVDAPAPNAVRKWIARKMNHILGVCKI